MFGQTYITLNTPLGRSAEVDIPSSPQRPFITTKELGLLTLELTALSSALLGCSRIQQPTQPLPSTETPIPPTDTTSQVKETTLPTQISTSLPPTQLPPPTPVETAQPAPPSKEEQPPTLETCKTTAEEVLERYLEENKETVEEMEAIVQDQGETIEDFRYKANYGYSYEMPTDGNLLKVPYCIKTKEGNTIGGARVSTVVYSVDGDKIIKKLVPLLIDLGNNKIIYLGANYMDENSGVSQEFIEELVE